VQEHATFEVLGPLGVTRRGSAVELRGNRRRALLLRLLVSPNEYIGGDRLADDVWDGDPPPGATSTLASHLSLLRGIVGPDRIESRGGAYRLIVQPGELDAACFQDEVDRGHQLLAEGNAARARQIIDIGLARWHGPALLDARAAPWSLGEVARLEALRANALDIRLQSMLALGDFDAVIRDAELVLAELPLHERVWAHLMIAFYRSGRQADALRAYQRARRHLVDELGIEPCAELRDLESAILRNDESLDGGAPGVLVAAPATPVESDSVERTARDADSDLPADPNDLVGRDALVARVDDLVASAAVVSLCGPGGVGKTRVAVRVAHDQRGRFHDGALFVDLAQIERGGEVAGLVLERLGAQPWADEPLAAALVRALKRSQVLLVLDNCEHVLESVRALVRCVATSCEGVHLLLTTREAVIDPAELVIKVDPLEVPATDAASIAEAEALASVQLFVARAASADRSFKMTDENAEAVVAIARALSGLPLAIELAAARLDVESVSELAATVGSGVVDRLEARHPMSARTSSVDGSVAWSYDAIPASTQRLLQTVSVFTGPFTRAVALDVHGGDGIEAHRDFDRLVRASLINRDGSATARFRALEPVKNFVWAQVGSEQRDVFRANHATHMAARAARCAPDIRTANQARAAASFRLDMADHRAAMASLIDRGADGLDDAARYLVDLFSYCHFQVVADVNRMAREVASALPVDHDLLAEVHGAAALGAWLDGRMELAIEFGESSIAAAEKRGSTAPHWARIALVDTYGFVGDSEKLIEHFDALVRNSREDPDPFWRINGLGYESIGALVAGLPELALQRAERALREARALGNPECIQLALQCMGRALGDSDPVAACEAFEAAIAVVEPVDSRLGRSLNLVGWVRVKRIVGAWPDATRGLVELFGLIRKSGFRSLLSSALGEAAYVLHHYGDDDAAVAALLGRTEPADMPALVDRELELREILESSTGERWPRLAVRARSRPMDDLIDLCEDALGAVTAL
jgi:predicted ATPase/DNA-binding SARP family transcriptional activator